jgi:hypothetical protein
MRHDAVARLPSAAARQQPWWGVPIALGAVGRAAYPAAVRGAVLTATSVTAGTGLSTRARQRPAAGAGRARGATVTGLDVSPGLLPSPATASPTPNCGSAICKNFLP